MMRSMFSGVSGLRIHQTKMDVIANNIANVNTVGYKSNRVTFNEVFSQTLSGASAANNATGRGGTNPRQIGLGASVASIDKLMTTGANQRTDNPLDIMISGEGFFVVGDNSGQYYTRAGNFIWDGAGNLSMNGLRLQGWDAQWDDEAKDYVVTKGTVKDIVIAGNKEYVPPEATTRVSVNGNINAAEDGTKGVERNITVFDSVGNEYTVPVRMKLASPQPSPTTSTVWTYEIIETTFPNASGTGTTTATCAFPNGNTSKPKVFTFTPPNGTMTFNTGGSLTEVKGSTTAAVTTSPFRVAMKMVPAAGTTLEPVSEFGAAGTNEIVIDFTELHQYAEGTTCRIDYEDGNAPGNLDGLSVGPDGKITGYYTNGTTRLLAQIPLAFFKNPAGLEKIGDNLFRATANSGTFNGTGDEGDMQGGVLEMSNVDLASEFTEMITTQRGFQANSRIITTSDDMLQELVNLKR